MGDVVSVTRQQILTDNIIEDLERPVLVNIKGKCKYSDKIIDENVEQVLHKDKWGEWVIGQGTTTKNSLTSGIVASVLEAQHPECPEDPKVLDQKIKQKEKAAEDDRLSIARKKAIILEIREREKKIPSEELKVLFKTQVSNNKKIGPIGSIDQLYRDSNTVDDDRSRMGWSPMDSTSEESLNELLKVLKDHENEKNGKKGWEIATGSKEFVCKIIGAKFVLIPAGTFTMGSPDSEVGRKNDENQHQVIITRPFYMQTTLVTTEQWKKIMGESYDSAQCNDCPVTGINWWDARNFIKVLNSREGTNNYRLPTEAKWEYAARAGTTGALYGNINDIAWYNENSSTKHPVGQKLPNKWGLYDMLGNALQLCQDEYPVAVTGAVPFVAARGASFNSPPNHVRAANRVMMRENQSEGTRGVGFRLVFLPDTEQGEEAITHFNQGKAYFNNKQFQNAIAEYNEAIRLKPDAANSYFSLGQAYVDLGQYEQAMTNFNEAIRLKPDFADAYNSRGSVYFVQGNNKRGCLDAKKACELGNCEAKKMAYENGYCLRGGYKPK